MHEHPVDAEAVPHAGWRSWPAGKIRKAATDPYFESVRRRMPQRYAVRPSHCSLMIKIRGVAAGHSR